MCNQRDYGMLYDQLRSDYYDLRKERDRLFNCLRAVKPFIDRDMPEAEGMRRYMNETLNEAQDGQQRRSVHWNGTTFKARP